MSTQVPSVIAIVGRPNVGKSALFNRIVGRRIAIVHDRPGVTRDRISAEAEWRGRPFTLVDTGGIGLLKGEKAGDVIVRAAMQQVDLAIEAAQVILLVVNVQEGVVPLDREVAQKLRRSGKAVLVIANKADTDQAEAGALEFAALGFDKILPVSAIHGRGTTAVMDAAMAFLPAPEASGSLPSDSPGDVDETAGVRSRSRSSSSRPPSPESEPEDGDEGRERKPVSGPLKIAIVGRPNVGKSSIINALTQSERVIVSPVPGTTRDAVDVPFEVETDGVRQAYLLIDTAGMRKTRRVDDSVEFFSVQRAQDSIARADLVVLVLDAEAGILEQDKKIADHITENRKACILVVNKWDLMQPAVQQAAAEERARKRASQKRERGKPEVMTSLADFGGWVQEKLFFLDYAPVIFTSAKSGLHLERLLEAIRYVAAQLQQKIPTSLLNRTLHEAVEYRQPVSSAGHRLKFFYATQVRQAPPTFLLFVNRVELFSDAYKKYLASQMRRAFGYEGCPVVLVPKARTRQ